MKFLNIITYPIKLVLITLVYIYKILISPLCVQNRWYVRQRVYGNCH